MKKLNVFWIVYGIFILLFFILNSFTGIAIDDFVYKHLMTNDPTKIGDRVTTLGDIVSSMQLHYFTTNGRLLVNGLAQLFLMSDNKIIFDIVNSLMFGLLILLVYFHAGLTLKKVDLSNLFFLILGFWFLIPGVNHSLLWLTGSINYLWSIDFVLVFLLVYKKLAANKKSISYFVLPLLFVFGFACGFTHEVITVGVSGALFFYYIMNIRKLKLDTAILVSGFMLGTLLLIIAPGNFIRLESGNEMNTGLVQLLIQRCGIILSIRDFVAFLFFLTILSIIKIKKSDYLKSFFLHNSLLISSILLSFLFIFLAGAYQPRVFFGVSVFSIILLLVIFNDFKSFLSTKLTTSILGVLIVIMLVQWINVRSDLKENYAVFKSDENIWSSSNQNVFPDRQKRMNRFVSNGLGGIDKDFWSNKVMSWYYKKNYMTFIPQGLYDDLNVNITSMSIEKASITNLNLDIKQAVFTNDSIVRYEGKSGYFCIPVSNGTFNFSKGKIHFEGTGNGYLASPSIKNKFLHDVMKREMPMVSNENNFYYPITLNDKKYIIFQKPQLLTLDKPLTISFFDPKEVLLIKIII